MDRAAASTTPVVSCLFPKFVRLDGLEVSLLVCVCVCVCVFEMWENLFSFLHHCSLLRLANLILLSYVVYLFRKFPENTLATF